MKEEEYDALKEKYVTCIRQEAKKHAKEMFDTENIDALPPGDREPFFLAEEDCAQKFKLKEKDHWNQTNTERKMVEILEEAQWEVSHNDERREFVYNEYEKLKKSSKTAAAFKNFAPLYHGTSSGYAKNIKKEGLKPRCDTKQCSVWEGHNEIRDISSLKDRVYFAQCSDYLPSTSADKAVKHQKNEIQNKLLREGKSDQEIEKAVSDANFVPAYLQLNNIEKYIDRFVDDEDANIDGELNASHYIDPSKAQIKNIKAGGMYSASSFCSHRMPTNTIDSLDRIWAVGGKEDVNSAIHAIGKGLMSIYFVQTAAIKGAVDPEDITVLTPEEWQQRTCQKNIRNGCNEEEYKIKQKYANDLKFYGYTISGDYRYKDVRKPGKDAMKFNEYAESIKKDALESGNELRSYIIHNKFTPEERKKLQLE